MLGFLLLYWIGKYFYKLAELYNKSQWGYTILGIGVYYVGIFLSGIAIGAVVEISAPGYLNDSNSMLFGLLAIPFGVLSTYLLYRYLENSWKRKSDALLDAIEVGANTKNIQ